MVSKSTTMLSNFTLTPIGTARSKRSEMVSVFDLIVTNDVATPTCPPTLGPDDGDGVVEVGMATSGGGGGGVMVIGIGVDGGGLAVLPSVVVAVVVVVAP